MQENQTGGKVERGRRGTLSPNHDAILYFASENPLKGEGTTNGQGGQIFEMRY